MKNFLQKVPLPAKLLIVGLLPLSFLLYFAIQIVISKHDEIVNIEKVKTQAGYASEFLKAVDEIQIERRLSYFYLIDTKDNGSSLMLQRAKTDAALKKLDELVRDVSPEYKEYALLNFLDIARKRVDLRNIPSVILIDYFNNILQRMTFSVPNVENVPSMTSVKDKLSAQKQITIMVSYFGSARLNFHQNLTKSTYGLDDMTPALMSYVMFVANEKEFLAEASPEVKNRYEKVRQFRPYKYTTDYFNSILASPTFEAKPLPPQEWITQTTLAFDHLKSFQRELIKEAAEGTETIYQRMLKEQNKTIAIAAMIALFVIVSVFYTIRLITESLQTIKISAEDLALGKTGLNLKAISKDIVGDVTNSIILLDKSNQRLSTATEQIGKGNFDITVEPRSADDTLSNAIIKMKNDLKTFTQANQDEIWLQKGVSMLNESMRGEKDLETISRDSLSTVCNYLNAQIGVLYVSEENDELFLRAGYGIESNVPHVIQAGKTLTGEAASSKRVIFLNNLPDSYLKISSATRSQLPDSVFIVPLIHNGITEGVIEIGCVGQFDPRTEGYLGSIQNSIAIAIHSAKNRVRLQELVEETQSQAEELQTQHNELETINSELEAQAQRLQASEEELKAQQQELQVANDELEERTRALEEKNHQIVESNLEIQKKAAELELSTRYKSEFLANMSHELRTPLNSILLLSRLLSENKHRNLNVEEVEFTKVIQNSGQSLLVLIDEILDLSKIESGKMTLELEKVRLEDTVNNLKSVFAPLAKEKKLEFAIEVKENVPGWIETDTLRMEQILKNLLSNALKFTSKGSVKLEIARDHKSEDKIRFSVVDTGIGIPHDKQKVIFEAFHQADGSTRRRFGGTGLGLSISRELAKLLGGDIELTSEIEKGSRFSLVVPEQVSITRTSNKGAEQQVATMYSPAIVREVPEPLADDREIIEPGDRVMLIVEDDKSFATTLQQHTREKGYKTIMSVRGDEVFDLAFKYKPSGILLDIHLPIKNGWDVLSELKKNKETRHIPVHVMSANEYRKESRMYGAVDFISKPFASQQMADVLNKIEYVINKTSHKVLLIEENPKHAKALSYFLDTFDINSEITSSIDDAIKAIDKKEVESVILDLNVLSQNDYSVLENIKLNPAFKNVPIIIFTGKNLTKSETAKIKQYAESIVVKTANSYRAMLDELSLFLHMVESKHGKSRKLVNLDNILAGKKILVADDDIRNIFSLTKALQNQNMEVITAENGEEALSALKDNPDTSIILMDMMMPEMDGYESIQHIRKEAKYADLPIIAVTAKAMTGDREKCIQAGASDYISKPVDIDQLISLLRVWLYK